VSGFKEDNSPILIVPFGTWDMKRVIKEVGPEELHRYAYVSVQNILRLMEERSRFPDEVVTQFWAVIDFEGYSMRQLTSLSGRLKAQNLPKYTSVCGNSSDILVLSCLKQY
jgi:Zn-dependent peptidase ImmA (M78 family)